MNWYANIKNRVKRTSKYNENRDKREQEALNAVIFGVQPSEKATANDTTAKRLIKEDSKSILKHAIDRDRIKTMQNQHNRKSSDLMMLSKIKPVAHKPMNVKRKIDESSSTTDSLRKNKKQYEPAFIPNTSTSMKKIEEAGMFGMEGTEMMLSDPIDDLELSLPTPGSEDESEQNADEIIFFNEGTRVNEKGVPVYSSDVSTLFVSDSYDRVPKQSEEAEPGKVIHDYSAYPMKGRKVSLSELTNNNLSSFLE